MTIQQMPKLEWDESISIGIAKFDNQHKVLIDYINDMRDVMMGNVKETEVIEKTLHSILGYTLTHFIDEEVFLYKNEYPGFEEHKAIHDQFILDIRELYVRFKSDKSYGRIICAEITAVLTEWLQVHIMKTDKEYSEWIKEKGLAPE